MYFTFGAALDTHALPPPFHDPGIQVARVMDVLGEDHRAIHPAKEHR